MPPSPRRRVVITGFGCVTPLGNDAVSTWEAAVRGASGVAALEDTAFEGMPVRFAGSVRGQVDAGDIEPKERRRLDRVTLFALAAAREAAADAGLRAGGFDPDRAGVAMGSAIGGLGTILSNHVGFLSGGPRRVSPFAIPMALANMPGAYVAIKHGLRGQNFAHVSACASGAHALGEAARAIARGDADVMLAGGCEAATLPFVVAGFANMQALSRRGDEPARASRPFDLERDGFVMAEGAGTLVLEAEEHARARGARVRAWLLGYAATEDASHVAAPDEDGHGARRCMALALADAGIGPGDVHYVNAHATSTPAGDRAEARALRAVFGRAVDALPVSSTKGMTGHMLGAAGAVEAILCVRALETGLLPPTINLDRPDPDCVLDHVAHKAREADPRVVLSNAFGFGGANSSLVLARG